MDGDDRPGSHRGTPDETPVSAVETLSVRDRGRGRSLTRDLGLLSLVAAPQVFSLVVVGDVDWLAFSIAAAAIGILAALALRWPPMYRPGDWRRQLAVYGFTVVGIGVALYYVLVVEPPESQFLSSLLGWHVGAAGARINYISAARESRRSRRA